MKTTYGLIKVRKFLFYIKIQCVLRVEDYCEPIIDITTWNTTRANLEKNKHPNYGEHIHLFAGLVKCPLCGEILAASESFKKYKNETKIYYHLRCKNTNCKGQGYHYNSDKIEDKLKRIINCPYIEGNNIVDTLILIPKTGYLKK